MKINCIWVGFKRAALSFWNVSNKMGTFLCLVAAFCSTATSFPLMQNRKYPDVASVSACCDRLQQINTLPSPRRFLPRSETRRTFIADFYSSVFSPRCCCSFSLLGCCLTWARRCGRTGSGSPKATAGPTWPTMTEKFSPNCRTCGLPYPSPSASCLSGKYLRGEQTRLFASYESFLFQFKRNMCYLFRRVACPLASLLGVHDKKRVCAPPNPVLEAFFCHTSKHPTQVPVHAEMVHAVWQIWSGSGFGVWRWDL